MGSAGLPALAAALRHQPRDLETLRAVLECLSSALGEVVGTAASKAAAEAEFQQVKNGEVGGGEECVSFLPFLFLYLSSSLTSLSNPLFLTKTIKRQSPRPPSTASFSPGTRPTSPRCSLCFLKTAAVAAK